MNIYITLDYEIYFGATPGTASKCLIEPTNKLLEIAKKQDIRYCFFIDAGYLLAMRRCRNQFASIAADYDKVTKQLERIVKEGHDIQLHVHPHWEDTNFEDGNWNMNTSRYKLADFNRSEAKEIITRYKKVLEEFAVNRIDTFRAGGWCIQPFEHIMEGLSANGISKDSSIFKNGICKEGVYNYEFGQCPVGTSWNFETDPLKESSNGRFLELPITNIEIGPFFFWKLFFFGRLRPKQHKPIGDGYPVSFKGQRRRMLTRRGVYSSSVDGYFVTLLGKTLKALCRDKKNKEFVVYGHPKAVTEFSLKELDRFIARNKAEHNFVTFSMN